ncbi:hypothetical protein AB0M46_28110 [Dactylosporangium sp. NPDC051485]|uniref:hypothetical protein n=1 Tax=Dactylosporangium sp. NPDC051485 TaxID=3154846 RepID=UPI0034476F8F
MHLRLLAVGAVLLGGVTGCAADGPKYPILGTTDVCSLFDRAVLTAAVPDGQVRGSALDDVEGSNGNYGYCEFSNVMGTFPADRDFAVLRLEIRKYASEEDFVNRHWAQDDLGGTCQNFMNGAYAEGATAPVDQWCASTREDNDGVPDYYYYFAARRDTVKVTAYYVYPLAKPAAEVEHIHAVTRVAAESAFR